VLFSSVASLLGSPGQANYAAANAALDRTACDLVRQGVAAVGVQWGPWKAAGMALQTAAKNEAAGIGALTPSQGLAALEAALRMLAAAGTVTSMPSSAAVAGAPSGASFSGAVAASPFDWRKVVRASRKPAPPLLAAIMGPDAPGAAAPGAQDVKASGTGPTSRGVLLAQQADQIRSHVAAAVSSVLGGAGGVAADAPLMSAGLDSLGAVELRNALEARVGLALPPTLVFDYPSMDAISQYIIDATSTAPTLDASADAVPITAMEAPFQHLPQQHGLGPLQRQSAPTAVHGVLAMTERRPGSSCSTLAGCSMPADAISAIPACRCGFGRTDCAVQSHCCEVPCACC
jgi:acyl carrier protein